MKITYTIKILLLLLFLSLYGCEVCQPDKNTGNNLVIRTYAGKPEVITKMKFDSVYASNKATQLLYNSNNELLDEFILPLNFNDNQCQFIFVKSSRKDTLIVTYDRKINYKHSDCGTEKIIQNLEIKKSTFTKTELKSTTLSPLLSENIRIFF